MATDLAPPASALQRWVPIVGVLRSYERRSLPFDLIAGLTLWGLVVPEGIAYAGIAGLAPQAGLYTLLAGLAAYGIFGTSRQLAASATSATAALIGSTVAALHPADAARYAALAAALVLLVGIAFLAAGIARLGFITQFLSRPVTEGFIIGLAIFVGVGQLNKLFGVEKGSGNVVRKFWHVVTQLDDANWTSFAVGAVAIALLFVLPRVAPRIPSGLVVLAAGILVSGAFDLESRRGVEVVGKLPSGLPSLALPHIAAADLWTLVPTAVGILLLGFSEALAVADDLARKHGYEIDPNQELRAFGIANLASGLFGGMVACGGMSSSAVNDGSGARSQVSVLVTAAATVVTVIALTPLFTSLPEAVLAALIIHAISHMLKFRALRSVARISPTEFWLAVLALAGVVLIDVLQGLVIAMLASLLLHIYRSSRPHLAVLGFDPANDRYGDIELHPAATTIPGVLAVRLDAQLYYANANTFRAELKSRIAEADPPIGVVVLDAEVQFELDVTSLEMLDELVDWLDDHDVGFLVVRPRPRVVATLDQFGLLERIGDGRLVESLEVAMQRARSEMARPTA